MRWSGVVVLDEVKINGIVGSNTLLTYWNSHEPADLGVTALVVRQDVVGQAALGAGRLAMEHGRLRQQRQSAA
jgi:hypothetical protein